MLSSLEVGAVFRVENLASAALLRITDEMKALNVELDAAKKAMKSISSTAFAGLNTRIGSVTDSIKGIGDVGATAAERMASSFDAATVAMSASLGRVAAQMAGLSSTAGRVALPGVASGPSALLGGPRGSGTPLPGWHGGGGGHIGGSGNVPLPAGQHASFGSTPAMAAAGIAFWGLDEAARLDDTIYKSLVASGHKVSGKLTDDPYYKPLRDIVLDTYSKTGLPLGDIEDAELNAIRITAPLPLDQRLKILKTLMPEATSEAFMKKGTSTDEAARAMAGLMHMSGQYQGPQADELLKDFVYLSTQTDASLPQTERAASYAIPLLRIAGFDPKQLLFGLTAMQRAGILNSKSGTWIENMLERSFPGTSVMSNLAFKKHETALKELGLIDDKGKQTFLDANGRPDLFKFFDTVSEHSRDLPKNEMLGVYKQLFGQQGERAAAFFSDPTNEAMLKASIAGKDDFVSGEALWNAAREQDPVVTFRTSLAAFNRELIDAAEKELPEATKGLKEIIDDFHSLGSFLDGLNTSASDLGKRLHDFFHIPDLTGRGNLDTTGPTSGGWFPWSRGGSMTLSGMHSSIYGPGNGVGTGESNRGVGGWWTQDRMQHAADRLEKEAGLSPMGASALVARWAGVEASGGPTSSNNIGGGHWGIAQWDSARGGPAMASSSFDDQLTHAVGELNGSERAAGDALRSAKTLAEGAVGASRYERAEHYNPSTGIDDSTANTPVGSVYRKLYGTADKAAVAPAPRGNAATYDQLMDAAYKNQAGDDMDPSTHARAKEHVTNISLNVDGKLLARVAAKHLVRNSLYARGPSFADYAALPQGIDSGLMPAA
jgi:hypothetical protein